MDKDTRPIPPSAGPAGTEETEDENEFDDALDRSKSHSVSISSRRFGGSRSSLLSEASEEDPRQIGLENGIFGDYDMKKSPSTKDFVLSYIDDEMARRNLPGRLSSVANESLTSKKRRSNDMRESGMEHGSVSKADEDHAEHIKIEYEGEEASLHRMGSKREESLSYQVVKATTEVFMEGVESIVDDDFWKCFQSHKPRPWNWNAYLWPLWFCGVIIRYFVLFPVRLAIFALGWLLFGIGMLIVQLSFKPGDKRTALEHSLISMMCGVFCITWGAVIRYHGAPLKTKPGECQPVYVANHTSMIDVIILQQMRCFSLVGQRHKGIVRFLQEVVLAGLQCVWFDRGEIKDRTAVARKLKEHVSDPTCNPLLVFPEGTCVNNEYVIQFKKGIFELGAPVVPVAIKYNKMFVDPFWNSRKQSFPMHLVELMTSWCLICEVWYLKPHVQEPGETSADFAGRVKKAIADKAGLKNVNWDGYMKYWKPSERYLRARQATLAKSLRKILARSTEEENAAQQARLNAMSHFAVDEDRHGLRRRMPTA